MNLSHRSATKLCRTGGREEPPLNPPEERSNQMRKVLPFTLGVLVGTIVATAWAHFPPHSTVTASTPGTAPRPAAASMNPLDMMLNLRPLPLQQFDPF